MHPRVISSELLHYISFYVDGTNRTSEKVEPQQVKNRSLRTLKIPNDVFALEFFDLLVTKVKLGRRTIVQSDRINNSDTYHVGHAYTERQIREKFPIEADRVIRELHFHGYKRAGRSLNGKWYILHDDDIVVPPTPKLKPKKSGRKLPRIPIPTV